MPRLEHIGIAVDEVETVIDCLRDLLGMTPYKAEAVAEQHVRTHFLDAESAKLELLEALDADSAVQKFLDKRGEGLHHLAFEVADADATMDRLRQAGFTLLNDAPQSGADDKRIFFVHPKETHGVLVEFCESAPPSWTPRLVPHRGGSLAVYERGTVDRPTVIVLHGAAGSTLFDSAPLMRQLEPSFHVVGVDLCGHGASDMPPDDELTLDRFAADVLAALDAVDASSAYLFGFSLGASVALRVARTEPGRIDRLALMSPNVVWTEALVDAMTNRLDVEALRDRKPNRAEVLIQQHEHPGRLFPALRSFVASLPEKSDAARDALKKVNHQTLVTALDADPLFPLESTTSIYQKLPNARLSVLPGSLHSLRHAPLSVLTPLLQRHFSQK